MTILILGSLQKIIPYFLLKVKIFFKNSKNPQMLREDEQGLQREDLMVRCKAKIFLFLCLNLSFYLCYFFQQGLQEIGRERFFISYILFTMRILRWFLNASSGLSTSFPANILRFRIIEICTNLVYIQSKFAKILILESEA